MQQLVIISNNSHSNYRLSSQKAETTAEVSYLESRIEGYKLSLKNLEKDPTHIKWGETQKDIVLNWVSDLKRLTELGVRKESIDTIGSEVMSFLKDNELTTTNYLYRAIPRDCKQHQYLVGTHSPNVNEQKFQSLKQNYAINSLYELDPEKLRDAYNVANSAKDHVEFVAKAKNISLVGHKHKRDIISTPKPNPDDTTATFVAALDVHRELKAFLENWEGVVDKIKEFPIEDKAKDRDCAKRISSLANMFQGFGELLPSCKDLKHAQSLWRWFDTIVEESRHGKHAAAVYKKVKAVGGKYEGKVRPLTRERVGDIKEKIWEDMQNFSLAMDVYAWWLGLINWRDDYGEVTQRVASRRIEEGPRLSESAFGSDDV
jgi:hypothetical protein